MRKLYVLIFLVFAANHFDRQLISILADPIARDLGLTDVQLGFVSGLSFAFVFGVASFPFGTLSATRSRRNMIAYSAIFWSLMTMLSSTATGFWQLLITRMGLAIGESASLPPAYSIVSDSGNEQGRVRRLSILTAGAATGNLAAFIIGGFIAVHYGWRTALLVAGLPGIVLALLLLTLTKEPARHRDLAVAQDETRSLRIVRRTLKATLTDRVLRFVFAGAMLNYIVLESAIYWYPTFLMRSHGYTPLEAGLLMSLGSLLSIAGAVGSGLLLERVLRKFASRGSQWLAWLPMIVIIIGTPFDIIFLLSDDHRIAIAAFTVPALFSSSMIAPTVTMAHERMSEMDRPLASAVFLAFGTFVGLLIGPFAIGSLSHWLSNGYGTASLRYALLSMQLFGLLAAGAFGLAGLASRREDYR